MLRGTEQDKNWSERPGEASWRRLTSIDRVQGRLPERLEPLKQGAHLWRRKVDGVLKSFKHTGLYPKSNGEPLKS